MEQTATSSFSPGSVFLVVGILVVLAALAAGIVVFTARGRLRWLWLNRHGLLRVPWRLVAFTILFSIVSLVTMVGLGLILHGLGLAGDDPGVGDGPLITQILSYVALIPAVFIPSALAVRFLDRRPVGGLGLGFHSRWIRQLLLGLLIGIVFVSAIVVMQAFTGTLRYGPGDAEPGVVINQTMLALLMFIGVAFFEELLFRGYLLQVLAEGFGDFAAYLRQRGTLQLASDRSAVQVGMWLAALLLAVPFGFVHYFNEGGTLVGAVSTGMAGLVLAQAYFRTRSLWVPIGMHVTWNFFMGSVYSLPVSGTNMDVTPFTADITGPEWLSGGIFGPEGSILCFLAMAVMALYLFRARSMDATADSVAAYPMPAERRKKRGVELAERSTPDCPAEQAPTTMTVEPRPPSDAS